MVECADSLDKFGIELAVNLHVAQREVFQGILFHPLVGLYRSHLPTGVTVGGHLHEGNALVELLVFEGHADGFLALAGQCGRIDCLTGHEIGAGELCQHLGETHGVSHDLQEVVIGYLELIMQVEVQMEL